MNKMQRIKNLIEICKERGITPYQIGKNTKLSSFAVHKIFTGETKNPSDLTLDSIYNYVEGHHFDNQHSTVNEDDTTYERITAEEIIAEKVADKIEPMLNQIRKNIEYINVKLENLANKL
jgi:hypothetical protein